MFISYEKYFWQIIFFPNYKRTKKKNSWKSNRMFHMHKEIDIVLISTLSYISSLFRYFHLPSIAIYLHIYYLSLLASDIAFWSQNTTFPLVSSSTATIQPNSKSNHGGNIRKVLWRREWDEDFWHEKSETVGKSPK